MNEMTHGFEVFSSWYRHDGQGSGPGSSPEYTNRYRTFLETFIRERKIKSVVDYGCGDWQFSQLVRWGDVEYTGLEIVPDLVSRLQINYETKHRHFLCVDSDNPEIPKCDLLIIKDVMQHLTNADILRLERLFQKKADNILYVNDLHHDPSKNNFDILRGDYRRLDLRIQPFNFNVKMLFEFGYEPDHKVAFCSGEVK
jgi:SAM-dependent methyltransferase